MTQSEMPYDPIQAYHGLHGLGGTGNMLGALEFSVFFCVMPGFAAAR